MPKFNVGDKVKIVRALNASDWIGLECTVVDDPDLSWSIESNREIYGEESIALYPVNGRPGYYRDNDSNRYLTFLWNADYLERI